jgi:hypothetical protein
LKEKAETVVDVLRVNDVYLVGKLRVGVPRGRRNRNWRIGALRCSETEKLEVSTLKTGGNNHSKPETRIKTGTVKAQPAVSKALQKIAAIKRAGWLWLKREPKRRTSSHYSAIGKTNELDRRKTFFVVITNQYMEQ